MTAARQAPDVTDIDPTLMSDAELREHIAQATAFLTCGEATPPCKVCTDMATEDVDGIPPQLVLAIARGLRGLYGQPDQPFPGRLDYSHGVVIARYVLKATTAVTHHLRFAWKTR